MRVLKAKSTPLNSRKGIRFPSEARMLQWLFQVIQLLQQLKAHHQPILIQPGNKIPPHKPSAFLTSLFIRF